MITRPGAIALFCLAALFMAGSSVRAQLLDPIDPAHALKPSSASQDAAATLVIFNSRDQESKDLAQFYAGKRGIPAEQVLGLPCALSEEITRDDYDRTIAEPLRRAFTTNFWWKLRAPDSPLGPVESNKIRFVALIRGMPLKIAAAANYPGDRTDGTPPVGSQNAAAVDSELAALGFFSNAISGAFNNPYYRSFSMIADARRPEVMLVCRLDGPTPAIVRRMIVDSLAAEEEGLAGFAYIDARGLDGSGLGEGDEWLRAAAGTARRQGLPVIMDNGPEMFPEGYPMRNAAIYYGWYTEHVAGPIARPDFRFVRGAVAVHIHSFSAVTVRDSLHQWVGPLLTSGAAATLGNVYEPFLTLTPHLDIFHDRLRAGFTFAEAAYMSQRVLSWMTTCVGDPLYRPFKGVELGDDRPKSGEWAAYRQGARLWYSKDRASGEAALRAAGKKLRSGIIFEGLGLLELTVNDRSAALAAFEQSRQYYTGDDDDIRVAIHEIIQLRTAGKATEALALTRKMIAAHPQAPGTSVVRMFDDPVPVTQPK